MGQPTAVTLSTAVAPSLAQPGLSLWMVFRPCHSPINLTPAVIGVARGWSVYRAARIRSSRSALNSLPFAPVAGAVGDQAGVRDYWAVVFFASILDELQGVAYNNSQFRQDGWSAHCSAA